MNNQEWDWKFIAILTQIVSLIQYIRDHPIPNRKLEVLCLFGQCKKTDYDIHIGNTPIRAYYNIQKSKKSRNLFFVLCYLFIEKRPAGRFFTVHLQFAVRALEHHQSLYVPVPLCRGDAL